MRANKRVRIPLATRATRRIRTTRIRRNIGSQGDVERLGTTSPALLFEASTNDMTFTAKKNYKLQTS